MGAYLSSPVVTPESIDEYSKQFDYGASSMQGWRMANEDAHSCILNYDEGSSLFAVFDGHGGSEVAIYSASKLPEFIKNHPLYKGDDMSKALQEAFIDFDVSLREPKIIEELKTIVEKEKGTDEGEEAAGSCDGKVVEDADAATLFNESKQPLPLILAKFYKKFVARLPNSPVVKPKANGSSSTEQSADSSKPEAEASTADAAAAVSESENSTETAKHKLVEGGDGPTEGSTEPGPSLPPNITGAIGEGFAKLLNNELEEDSDDSEFTWSDEEDSEDAGTDDDDDNEDDDDKEEDDDDDEDDEGAVMSSSSRRKNSKPQKSNSNQEDDEEDDDDDDEEEDDDEDGSGYPIPAMGMSSEPGKDSGCTAVVALFKNDTLYVANAGDSRCVLSRNGKAVDMSADHKPEDYEENLRITNAGGKISEDGRVNGGLNLSRAIGDHSYKKNEKLSPREQMITALPDIQSCKIDPETDEFVVLACDGIWNSMTSQEVIDFVRERIDKTDKLSKICEELFRHCLADDTTGDGTGCDNMTCIIVRTKKPNVQVANEPQITKDSEQQKPDEVANKTNGDSTNKRKANDSEDDDVNSKKVK